MTFPSVPWKLQAFHLLNAQRYGALPAARCSVRCSAALCLCWAAALLPVFAPAAFVHIQLVAVSWQGWKLPAHTCPRRVPGSPCSPTGLEGQG